MTEHKRRMSFWQQTAEDNRANRGQSRYFGRWRQSKSFLETLGYSSKPHRWTCESLRTQPLQASVPVLHYWKRNTKPKAYFLVWYFPFLRWLEEGKDKRRRERREASELVCVSCITEQNSTQHRPRDQLIKTNSSPRTVNHNTPITLLTLVAFASKYWEKKKEHNWANVGH